MTVSARGLSVSGVTQTFGDFVALQDVCLAIAPGETLALIGANGAGKSTLAHIVVGALLPTAGEVFLNGSRLTQWPMHRRVQAGVSIALQRNQSFQNLSVWDNLMCAVLAKSPHAYDGHTPRTRHVQIQRAAEELLQTFQLQADRDKLVATLPHGSLRLLELAMAFAGQPQLVVLDEPCAGLSPTEAAHMVGVIARIRLHTALLLIEHDMATVFALAHRIAVLDQGRLIACGAPEQIRQDPQVRAAYLGDH